MNTTNSTSSPEPHSTYKSYKTHTTYSRVPPENPSKTPVVPPVPHNFPKLLASRSDARLANLPFEDQQTLLDWLDCGLTFREIIEIAAKPLPEGLDLAISLGSLSRFYQKHALAERISAAVQLAQSLCPDAAHPDAALQLLAQTHATDALASPVIDQSAFQQITRYLLRQEDQRIRHRALDLHQKRLAFEMQHKHYDIMKRTIEKLPEINQIVHDKSLPLEERIRRDFRRIFGRENVEMVESANRKYREQYPEENYTEPDIDPKDLIPPLTSEEAQARTAEGVRALFAKPDSQSAQDSHPQ